MHIKVKLKTPYQPFDKTKTVRLRLREGLMASFMETCIYIDITLLFVLTHVNSHRIIRIMIVATQSAPTHNERRNLRVSKHAFLHGA